MSRSRRKLPIMGNANGASERHDKHLWHSRMRGHERQALARVARDDSRDHLATHRFEVSTVGDMAKDGKQFFALADQRVMALKKAQRRGKSVAERQALTARWLHKFMAK